MRRYTRRDGDPLAERPPRAPSSLRFKIAAASVMLVVALVGLELAARFVAPIVPGYKISPEKEEMVLLNSHPTRLWYTAPGVKQSAGFTASINELGLRGPLPADPKPADVPRILVVGDSSLFGHGVADNETLSAQLERALLGRGLRAEVINGGTPGYSTEQTLRFLDEVGWDLKPDLLLIGNLWSDNNYDWFQDADLLHTVNTFSGPLASSALFRISSTWVDRLKGGRGARIVSWTANSQVPTTAGRRVPLPQYAANLAKMMAQATEHGAGALVLSLTNIERIERGDSSKASWHPYFLAQAEIVRWFRVPMVDAHVVFTTAAAEPSTLFVDSMHPSAKGFALLAKATARLLGDAGWPERERFAPRTEPFPGLSVEDAAETDVPAPLSPQEELFMHVERSLPPGTPGK